MPNNLHAEIAIAAAQAGKMILCEKPLAMNGPQGLTMVEAVEKAGVANMVWYNYRRIPAVMLAHKLIEETGYHRRDGDLAELEALAWPSVVVTRPPSPKLASSSPSCS